MRLINKARGSDERARSDFLCTALEVLEREGKEHRSKATTPFDHSAEELEALLEDLLDWPSRRLAVYGTLAPGENNHHVIAQIQGTWEGGWVAGELGRIGPYPAFRWNPRANRIRVQLLSSPHLPRHWERLDRFEGSAYRRILAPVTIHAGAVKLANLYEAVELL